MSCWTAIRSARKRPHLFVSAKISPLGMGGWDGLIIKNSTQSDDMREEFVSCSDLQIADWPFWLHSRVDHELPLAALHEITLDPGAMAR